MRTAFVLALMMACGALQAGLEPRDEALLQAWLKRELKLPGAMPVGYAHQFEVGDLQEAEVLDRGTYRTIRLHVVAKLEERFLVEAHNGRGLVVAGLMDNNGVFTRAWAGRAGEKPDEIEYSEQPGPQELFHHALRVPWSAVLYQLPAVSFRDGEKFKLGATELSVQAPGYELSGVRYELLQSHGEDAWFGPHWQWKAGERVLYKVTRREKLAKPEPLLDWSEVVKGAPKPAKAPEWKSPKDEWEITKREDGSLLVFAYDASGVFCVRGTEPRVEFLVPGPFVVGSGSSLAAIITTQPWSLQQFAISQAARLPVSELWLHGEACSDKGLHAAAACKQLDALTLYNPSPRFAVGTPASGLTAAGSKELAGMSGLKTLRFLFGGESEQGTPEFWAPLKDMKGVVELQLTLRGAEAIPAALRGWTGLETLWFWGRGIDGIGGMTGLRELDLTGVEVSAEAGRQLAALPSLTKLHIGGGKFPPSALAKLAKLTELWLGMAAEDATWLIDSAARLKSLDKLSLAVPGLAGEDLLPLQKSSLKTLAVVGGLDEPDDVGALTKLKNLRELELRGVQGADAAALKALAVPGTLTKLTLTAPVLARSRKASEELAALSAFDYLEELHVREGGMAKAGPLGLAKFSGLKTLSLEKLNIEAELLAELAACPKLESLSFAGSLLPQGAVETLKKLKGLKTLNLRGCLSITPEDIAALKSALPGCAITQ
ncbi:MAG: hypothetical protein M5U25_20050 [Planctomycetota bacterium]|nr:hypothetical protein [Planctomycetota bacterium]